ncbi:MFS transporter (plasmid) [Nicoliella spurrieriana]|uniref:MFS transporter n=1 Tax=Nicoliella spurrieriana TaxID=2925830 RepID=A0A976RQA2_9LACO|nr:MFS transporter [Nicoliella spurrieriana]UQS85909.1 MFS transporter [Nicoliella spurrieriana]
MLEKKKFLTILGLFFGVFVTGADSFIISPILPEIARSFNASIALSAYGVTIYAIFFAVGSPLFGPLGDRYNKKTLLIIGILIFFVGSLLCGFSHTLIEFYIYRTIAGIGASLFVPNVWAFIGSNFNGKKLNQVMGIVMSGLSLSIAIGVPLGTLLAQLSNWHMAFWGSAVLTLVALLFILFAPKQNIINSKSVSYLASFKNVFLTKNAVPALMITLSWMIGFYGIYTFLGTYIQNNFKFNVAMTGYVFIAYGLSNFIASFFGGKVMNITGKKRSINLNAIFSIVFILGFIISKNNIWGIIILLILLAFAQGFGVTSLNSYIVNVVPSNRSTLMSFNSSFLYLGLTIGSGIGGIIYDSFGFAGVCLMASLGLFFAIIITNLLKGETQ